MFNYANGQMQNVPFVLSNTHTHSQNTFLQSKIAEKIM